MAKIKVLNQEITAIRYSETDYISLTDIAKYKDNQESNEIIRNWLRNRNTIEFLGIWEELYNQNFKVVEFDGFKNEAGLNSFTLGPKKWVEKTNAIGIISKAGRYGGTYAHKDIAFEFASWVSVEFKFYLIKEFQRLKEIKKEQLGWDIKRNLTKIHTDAIQENLIPKLLTKKDINFVYSNKADILNMALFGQTAKQWKDLNPTLKGNMRDYANVKQLICLANLESLNAYFINENISKEERIDQLNKTAINQMKILLKIKDMKKLEN